MKAYRQVALFFPFIAVLIPMACQKDLNPVTVAPVLAAFTSTATMTATPGVTPLMGRDWVEVNSGAPFEIRSGHTGVVFNNLMWVIAGLGNNGATILNDVWSSSDGVSWTCVNPNSAFPGRYLHSSVVYVNKMWVIAGWSINSSSTNDVWYSPDGITWSSATTQAAFPPRQQQAAVVFDNGTGSKMWVVGGQTFSSTSNPSGYLNDVWYSSDGITWNAATTQAAFSPRGGHSMVVYNNQMWVLGGYSPTGGTLNDVWSSSDGVNWTRSLANAAFSGISSQTTVSLNDISTNKIWTIGYNTWSSTDGISWYPSCATYNPFPHRVGEPVLAYNGHLWVIGGYPGSPGLDLNDVWRSP